MVSWEEGGGRGEEEHSTHPPTRLDHSHPTPPHLAPQLAGRVFSSSLTAVAVCSELTSLSFKKSPQLVRCDQMRAESSFGRALLCFTPQYSTSLLSRALYLLYLIYSLHRLS